MCARVHTCVSVCLCVCHGEGQIQLFARMDPFSYLIYFVPINYCLNQKTRSISRKRNCSDWKLLINTDIIV